MRSTGDVLRIERTSLSNESFAGRKLAQFTAIESNFECCDFREMIISLACFGGGQGDSTYFGCVFDRSQIVAKAPGCAVFERCSFLDVDFSEFNCRNIDLIDCNFSGEIKKGFFSGAISEEARIFLGRTRNRFEGNNFANVKLGDVGFRSGIDLQSQILPTGPEYIFLPDAETTVARAKRVGVDLSTVPKASLSVLLKLMERDIAAGQRQLFFNMKTFPPALQPAFEVIRQTMTTE